MIEKIHSAVHSIGESSLPLLEAAADALKNISIPNGPSLLTFWGNKGVGKTALLRNIAGQLAADYGVEVIGNYEMQRLSVEKTKQAILQGLKTASFDKPVLILFDDLDALLRRDSESFFDFERTVIQPLIERGNVLILCTSRIELNQWREYDVRIRQSNRQIQPMSYHELISLVADTGIPPKKAYKRTFGHPRVINWLRNDPTMPDKQLAQKSWDYFLDDIPEEARSIAAIISCFPLFNIYILKKTYESLNGHDLDYLVFLEWIKEYIRCGLMFWDVSVGSYRFTDSAVRRLLARHILQNDPETFEKVQGSASEYFRAEARSPGYLQLHLVSAIYHIAQAGRKSSQQAAGQQCLDWFESNRGTWQSARWTDVLNAWQEGAGEKAVMEEIQELIGIKQFNILTREIKKAGKLLEVKK